eukprot:COSAG06_NODE_17107_length_960_cov_2.334495_1_plen_69_part_00
MTDTELLPEIVIDVDAEDYVETDDEPEEPETPPKTRPPPEQVFEELSQSQPQPMYAPPGCSSSSITLP